MPELHAGDRTRYCVFPTLRYVTRRYWRRQAPKNYRRIISSLKVCHPYRIAVGSFWRASQIRAVSIIAVIAIIPETGLSDFTAKAECISIKLRPNQSIDTRVGMKAGSKVNFTWRADGGRVNYMILGESDARFKFYKSDRQSEGADGVLEAAFDGSHGWFWQNRSSEPVTVSLHVAGDYNFILTSP